MTAPTPRAGARTATMLALALAALVAASLLAPQSARADGDPPSDFLLSQDTFVPLKSPPSSDATAALAAAVRRANRKLPLKVAIVGTPVDLGTAGQLWNHPDQYAPFLYKEVSFTFRGTLLVVMPAGMAAAGSKSAAALHAAQAAPGTAVHAGDSGDRLTAAATRAVGAIAAGQAGRSGGGHGNDGTSHGGRRFTAVLAGGVVVGLLLAALLGSWIARRSRARRHDGPGGAHDDGSTPNG